MSRSTSPADRSDRVSTPGGVLFGALIDDAAVFPPGSAPLPEAISDHRCLRQSPAAGYVGPLLIPVAAVDTLLDLVGDPAEPLTIGLIGSPGEPAELVAAADRALARSGLTVGGVEIALAGRDVDALLAELRPFTDRGVPVAVEVARGGGGDADDELAALATHRDLIAGGLLRGKYRTGGVQPGAVPPAATLAAVIVTATRNQLPIKFTAGLHHAVRTAEQHGVLNVMAAIRWALDGATTDTVRTELERQDPSALAGELGSWAPDEAGAVRRLFTSFGCCGVLEPLTEAARLGLIPPLAHDLTVPGMTS